MLRPLSQVCFRQEKIAKPKLAIRDVVLRRVGQRLANSTTSVHTVSPL